MVSNGEGWIKEEHNWEHNRNDIVFDHYTIKLGFCWKGIGKQKNWKSLGSISEFYKRENENNGKGQDIKQEKKIDLKHDRCKKKISTTRIRRTISI